MIRNRLAGWAMGVALLLSACTDSARYAEALPADAALVSSVDLKVLAEKSGLTEAKDASLRELWKRMLGQDLGASEALLSRLLENPLASGLQLTDKVYLFLSPESEYAGVLFRVSDRSDLETLVEALHKQQLCEAPHVAAGSSWTVMGKVLAAWSDAAFLLMTSPKGEDPAGLQRQADRLLRQQESESFMATADYAQLQELKGDVVAMASLQVLPYQYVLPFTMGVSGDLKLKDVKALAALTFEEGKAVMEIKTRVADKVMQSLLDKQWQATEPLKGTYLDFFPKKTGSWVSFRADGKQLYELLNTHPNLRRRFQHSMIPLDFAAIFGAVKGDVAVAMPDPKGRSFIALAEVTGPEFLQTVEELKPMLAMTGGQAKLWNVGENAYEFRTSDASLVGLPAGPLALWFGVSGGHLYLTNDSKLLDVRVLGLSLRDTSWGSRAAGQRLVAAVNMEGVVPGADFATVECPDEKQIRIECTMKDGKTNVLRQWAELFGLH